MNQPALVLLPPQAAGLPAWRVLDTRFDPQRLYTLWQAWLQMPARPHVLHLVAFAPAGEALSTRAADPAHDPLAQELSAQWHGLLPGMHRFALARGRLQLTLGLGELLPLLREQQFEADALRLDPTLPWDRWHLKALARCCRRGTCVLAPPLSPEQHKPAQEAGFALQGTPGRYDPPWDLKTSRDPLRTRAATPTDCVVVGAGLAGASVAAVLARRGWQVQVLDAGLAPAAGASGLPVGLLVPHVSADDSPRSRLTRAGLRLMRQEAQDLLQAGQDWNPSGVLELRLDGRPGLPPHWPRAGLELSRPVAGGDEAWRAGSAKVPALWHAQAAWIKPARLVQAWLEQPGVCLRTGARVQALRRAGPRWQLLDREGAELASATVVVLANAADAPRLLATALCAADLPPLQEIRGVLSTGLRQDGDAAALPPFPVHGAGALIPAVPTPDGLAWYAGATYEAQPEPPAPALAHHQRNLDKLRALLPAAAQALAPAFAAETARGWGGTRCVSADRLPLVGPLEDGEAPTLWISAAMGSRGLSLALLCAELLAARLGAEPWPLEASLARFLHARRRSTGQTTVQRGTAQAESPP